jgi:NAD-dependent dihydropyrimidine dehydrogenase PreA subunit
MKEENGIEIVINYEKCPPCQDSTCIDTCPWGVFQIGSDKKPQVWDIASCTACGVCENLCPHKAIKLKRKDF